MCERLNHAIHSLWKATLPSGLRRPMSSASPSSNPSLRIIHHSSSVRSTTDVNMRVFHFQHVLMVSDHSTKQFVAECSMLSRNARDDSDEFTQSVNIRFNN